MPQPEVFTLRWEEMKHLSKQGIIERFFMKECLCNHASFFHSYEKATSPLLMEEYIAFIECGKCSCCMFKQDNLKYLETILREKEDAKAQS